MIKTHLPPIDNQHVNYSEDQDLIDEIRVSEKEIDNDAYFFVTFIDGSSFRAMIEYLRLTNTHGIFRFTKDKILYQQGNSDNTILNEVEIKTYELTDYEFHSRSEEIIVCVNLVRLRDITRSVGKKDHIDIYRLEGEPQNLYIQIRSQSEKGSSDPNKFLLPCEASDLTIYDMPDYERSKRNPNCTIFQSDFAKFCKSIVTIKCNHVRAHGFDHGIIFKGITNLNTIGSVKEFGKCNNCSSSESKPKSFFTPQNNNIIKASKPPPILNIGELGEIEKFTIPIPIMKYLTKINGLSPNGTIKMYIEKDKPLKMLCNIGTFGKLTIYIP